MSAQGAVEVERCADQRQMGQCLGEVPLLLAGAADLLGIQAQVVGVGEHFLERQPRLVQAPGARERLDVPKRARREGAFGAAYPVRAGLRIVTVDQGIGDQAGGQRVEGGQPLGSVGEMNLTSGISKTAASRTSPPSYWVNASSVGDQPRSMIRR